MQFENPNVSGKRGAKALIILAWVARATGVPPIPNMHEEMDASSHT